MILTSILLNDYNSYKQFYKYSSRLIFIQVIMTPGYLLLTMYRCYSAIYRLGGLFKIFGRFIWLLSYFIFGCDINPRCIINGPLIMPHPIGIVIGEGVVLNGLNIVYQNVTLGINKKQYPSLLNSKVYSGAVVCGKVDLKNEVIPALSLVLTNNIVERDS